MHYLKHAMTSKSKRFYNYMAIILKETWFIVSFHIQKVVVFFGNLFLLAQKQNLQTQAYSKNIWRNSLVKEKIKYISILNDSDTVMMIWSLSNKLYSYIIAIYTNSQTTHFLCCISPRKYINSYKIIVSKEVVFRIPSFLNQPH